MAVLAAIDTESGSEAVVSTGADLAEALDETLVVHHVVPEGEEVDAAREAVETTVERALGDSDRATVTVQSGNETAHFVLEKAADADAAYIVVGSRKQTPVGKALLGSVSQLIILNSERPVVTVPEPE